MPSAPPFDNSDTSAQGEGSVVREHKKMTPGYESLRTGAALIDLSRRGRIRATGEDRARLLHAMTTNHVQQMKPGDGIYVFFLNAQGRIVADACLLCFEDHFLIDTEPEARQTLYDHLDHYIIADDVTLVDETDSTFCFGLEGPKAADIAARCELQAPHHRFSHLMSKELEVASISATGSHGIRIYGPAGRREEVIAMVEAAGAVAASEQDAETMRIENFVPRFGCDITEHTLPQETQQMHGLHFQKGCYLGQEIVERIRSRGHVNRLLMGFRIDGLSTPPPPGTRLMLEGQAAGEVSSSAATPDAVFGLAYIRTQWAKSGAMAEIDGHAAALFAPHD